MARRKNSPEPPVMTWPKATPFLVLAAVFDALRFMFEWFIFFGPALAGVACTVSANNTAIGNAVGTAVTESVCGGGAVAAGFLGAGIIGPLGIVMAMVTGFAGWLAVGIALVMFNRRIFKENALWFAASLLVSEVPFIGSVPAITLAVWKMHGTQIRVEKAAHKKWADEQAAQQLQERNQQAAELMQLQATQQAQIMQQEAANNAAYAEAANDEEIPESVREAA
ncbi:hypothetical protein HY972_01095 [Candidatus Kaiserbacteria bacterium]|nr:hypothetical protein [Candidatus Kaiserbacteria bacterium]